MNTSSRIYVAGHTGTVGSAIVRCLQREGYQHLLLRTRTELDLMDQRAVRSFFETERPEYVIDAAARVGGIKANMTYPAEFLNQNLTMQSNIIWSAFESDVKKLLFLGSSCIYPRGCPQPMKEEYLLSGKPEPTNEGYAIAKIAGLKLCEKIHEEYGRTFISCMPTNIYGEGDHFNPDTSHVIPALMRRMHDAKIQHAPEVVIWGSGTSRREFLYVDDLADAVVWMMRQYDERLFLNIGTGVDLSIRELAELMRNVIGYPGALTFDATKPDGMPLKRLDVSRINALGWQYTVDLEEGLRKTYAWFQQHVA